MNPKTIMSYEEFKQFFSHTAEFTTKDCGDDTYLLTYEEDGHKVSQLIYQPTVQTILRKLEALFYNFFHKIYD